MKKTVFITVTVIVIVSIAMFLRYMLNPPIPDANRVYERFFAEYSFPDYMKTEIIKELKLIINFIYYYKNSGKDYVSLMRFLKNYSRRPFLAGKLEQEARYREDPDANGVRQTVKAERHEYCRGFKNFLESQKSLAVRYSLPYRIPGSSMSYINIKDSILAKDLNGSETLHAGGREADKALADKLRSIGWKNGDIILAHRSMPGKGSSLQGYYNHVGIYDHKCDCIIDAMPEGVRKSEWGFWAKNFSDMVLLRFDGLHPDNIEKAVDYARMQIGKPYSLLTYKRNEKGGWYCSKLVYMAYRKIGVDMDIKKGVSVLPDDIMLAFGGKDIRCLENIFR